MVSVLSGPQQHLQSAQANNLVKANQYFEELLIGLVFQTGSLVYETMKAIPHALANF